MRGAARVTAPLVRATTSAASLYVVATLSALLLATGSGSPAGGSLTVALALVGAVAVAATTSGRVALLRLVVTRVAAAIYLVLTVLHRPPHAPRPAPLRLQDPAAPGRRRPRAPGATPLPSTA